MGNYRLHVGEDKLRVSEDKSFYHHTTDGGRTHVDRICEAISNETCRYVLYALDGDEPVELEDIVDEVVKRQTGLPPTDVDDGAQETLRTKLHHHHLPKLSDLGIVEYDPRSGAIRYREPPPHLNEFLHLTQKLDTE